MLFFLFSSLEQEAAEALKKKLAQDRLLNHPTFKSCLNEKDPIDCYYKILNRLTPKEIKTLNHETHLLDLYPENKKNKEFLQERILEGLLGKGYKVSKQQLNRMDLLKLMDSLTSRRLLLQIGAYCLNKKTASFKCKDSICLLQENSENLESSFELCLKGLKLDCPKNPEACLLQRSIKEHLSGKKQLDLAYKQLEEAQGIALDLDQIEIEKNFEKIVYLSSQEVNEKKSETKLIKDDLDLKTALYKKVLTSQTKEELLKNTESLGLNMDELREQKEEVLRKLLLEKYLQEQEGLRQQINLVEESQKEPLVEKKLVHYVNIISSMLFIENNPPRRFIEPSEIEIENLPKEYQDYVKNIVGKNENHFKKAGEVVVMPISFLEALLK